MTEHLEPLRCLNQYNQFGDQSSRELKHIRLVLFLINFFFIRFIPFITQNHIFEEMLKYEQQACAVFISTN